MQTTLHSISREATLRLAEQSPLNELLTAATELRAAGKGRVITFSKKVFIPLTTLCRDYCTYCTFRKDPGQPGAHFMTPDEVFALAERGRRAGCKEALFSLGDQPEKIFPEAREFLRTQGFSRTLDTSALASCARACRTPKLRTRCPLSASVPSKKPANSQSPSLAESSSASAKRWRSASTHSLPFERSTKNTATSRKSSSRIFALSRIFPWPRIPSRLLKTCCAPSPSPA